MLENASEETSHKRKSEEVMEIYLHTLYTCAKSNIPPNDGLDNLLTLQMEKDLNFDEIKIRDEDLQMSERNTGES